MIFLFLLTLAGGVLLQAGTNLYNTYGDFVSGVDTIESAVTCPQLVSGQMTPEAMRRAGQWTFGLAGLITLALTWFCGPVLAFFGILGISSGWLYTNGIPYKYSGLGPILVAVLMGPLMVIPAYYAQTGNIALAPVLGSLSIACLVSAILHANDMRDIRHDRDAGIRTTAMLLGMSGSVALYAALTTGAFVTAALNVLSGILPWPCLVVFLLFPKLMKELTAMRRQSYNFTPLEGWTARFHMEFGALLALGPVAHAVLRYTAT